MAYCETALLYQQILSSRNANPRTKKAYDKHKKECEICKSSLKN